MNQTQYNARRKGRYINRLPVSALIYVLDNKYGWVGWCPLNGQWAAAHWYVGYQLFPTLRQALAAIKWHTGDQRDKRVNETITRFREVFHIGGLVYRVSDQIHDHHAQAFKYNPQAERPLSFIR